jgi:pimeloyl-ACP methyl ester carboxylesterase
MRADEFRPATCVQEPAVMDPSSHNGEANAGLCSVSTWRVNDLELEVFARGPAGAERLLVLHDLDYLNGVEYPFTAELAKHWRVISPSHPGFGGSTLPPSFDSIADLAYVYLDVLRQTGPAHLIGLGFGGWIAAEIAIRCTHDVQSLVLVDALGIKVGDRTSRDIADMFVVSPGELVNLSWHDSQRGEREMPLPVANRGFDEDQLTLMLNNRKTAAVLAWKPFMHDPKLRARLARVNRPTLVVWGASDGIVSPVYGRAYARSIPAARFELIDQAGHYPYLEQPAAFLETVEPFLAGVPRA